MDGRMFIKTVVKEKWLNTAGKELVAIMNLPALAVEFLDAFVGLFDDEDILPKIGQIKVHCYCFSKGKDIRLSLFL